MPLFVLAHQGGWDEALLVIVPIAVFVALLMLANKRAKAVQQRRADESATNAHLSEPPPPAEPS